MRRLLACVVAVAVAAALVVFVLDDDEERPSEWDERVADLVAFVEDERGHEFDHPVPVDFLTDEEYTELTRTDAAGLTDEELEEIEQVEGLLRALGLVEGDLDLVETSNDLVDTGTLAYYDIEAERVVVRGTEVTPALAVTLVHELTHVLQDQVFGLDLLVAEDHEGQDDDGPTSGQTFAFRAVAEGDAGRIEQAYLETLSDEEQAGIASAEDEGLDDLEAEGIPVALQALFAAPYPLGQGLVALLDVEDDIDDAFTDPPTTEEHLLDPFGYREGDPPTAVDAPDSDGAEVLDEGDFGAVSILFVLAERIDLLQALDAALGWGGDAYVAFERDGATCLRYAVVGDETADTDQLAAAFEAWVAAAPAGSASTAREGDLVRFESCDPGDGSTAGNGAALDALTLAAARTQIAVAEMQTGASATQAACFGDAVIRVVTPEELVSASVPDDLQQRIVGAAQSCV